MADLQAEVEKLLQRVDSEQQRPLLKRSFEACARCASDSKASIAEFQACLLRARAPVTAAEQALNREMNTLQERLQRCTLACQDKLDDALPRGREPSAEEQEKLRAGLFKCVEACSAEGITLLPKIYERVKQHAR